MLKWARKNCLICRLARLFGACKIAEPEVEPEVDETGLNETEVS